MTQDGYNLSTNSEESITDTFFTTEQQVGHNLFTELVTWAWLRAARVKKDMAFKSPPPFKWHSKSPLAAAMSDAWNQSMASDEHQPQFDVIHAQIDAIVKRHHKSPPGQRE